MFSFLKLYLIWQNLVMNIIKKVKIILFTKITQKICKLGVGSVSMKTKQNSKFLLTLLCFKTTKSGTVRVIVVLKIDCDTTV